MKRLVLLFVLLASLAALPAMATVPSTMSYQGVLTDGAGNLVPDGPYTLTFRIYTVPAAGVALWTEVDAAVPVVKGGFSLVLGNVTSLSGLAFNAKYYLGITVAAGPELAPRVELASSPYGMALRLPFAGSESSAGPVLSIHNGGAGPAITADPRLDVGTPTSTGTLNWYTGGSANPVGILGSGGSGGGQWDLYDSAGNRFSSAYNLGPGAGWIFCLTGSPFLGIGMGGMSDPAMTWLGSASSIFLDGAQAGDNSVQLPTNAINSAEMLDEPGIASNHSSGSIYITSTSELSYMDIQSVTITTPAAGYIVVNTTGEVVISAGAGFLYQITETSGSASDPSDYHFMGSNVSTFNYASPFTAHRIYFKGAGTHTFYFQATMIYGTDSDAYVWQPTLTAEYFPTGYGAVTTAVTAPNAATFEHATAVTTSPIAKQPGSGGTFYQVDLRELELKVARQQAALARTQLDLARAKFAAQARAGHAAPVTKP